MRITGLKVDGFGVWSGLELSELSDQLNVFYGPNEAGKTTLMQFVRSMLYGFAPDRRARYLPPVRPGRPGGTLGTIVGGEAFAISRHADVPGEMTETLSITGGQQKFEDEKALSTLLGHVDESIFNNVFAFGLREIQELGTLSDTQAADELYNLALGVDRVSLVDVLRELEMSRNRLLAADDRPSLVTQLISQRERLRSELEELSQATPRYLALTSQRQKLAAEIARLEQENAECDRQGRELALARALSERWHRQKAIDQQLTASVAYGALPESALARFDRLQSRLALRRRRFARLRKQRRELRGQIVQLNINEPLCRQALRIEALGEQQQWIASLDGQVTQLEVELLDLETAREQNAKQWGIPGGASPAGRATLSKRGLAELRAAGKSLHKARRQLRELRSQTTTAAENARRHAEQIESSLGTAKDKGFTQSLAEAGELVSKLRKRVQLDERLDQMSRHNAELDQQSQQHLDRQLLPAWALVGLGALFVLGCAFVLLFLAGLILPASLSGALGWPLGLVGACMAGVAVALKFGLEHAAVRQLDTCHQQMSSLSQQIKQAKTERDELDAELPRGGGPLVARLQAAEKSLARLEELVPLEGQREAAHREAAAAEGQDQVLGRECETALKRWRQLLAQYGLPRTLVPRQLREYWRRHHQIRGLASSIEEKQQELGRRKAEFQIMVGRISQLVVQSGVVARSQRPLDQLQQCLSELAEQQLRLKRREELTSQIAKLRRRQRKFKREAAKLRAARQSLLNAAGTDDEQEFRRRALAQADSQRLQGERARIAQEIAAALGSHCSEETLARWIAIPQGLGTAEVQLNEARQTVSRQLSDSLEKRGQMSEQLRTLLADRQLPQKRIELSVVEKRLQDALDRWRVLTICGIMLGAVREYYEREHQPQALREASIHLQRLTGGRYTRVWTPFGEHSLKVDDGQGHSLNVEVLSRGTREQLFLALRLALITSFARRGVQLPLVLDDVLVNFDVGRARAAALVLRDFAKEGHQILIFTCHEHISKLFKNIKAEVRQLPDNGRPQDTIAPDPMLKRPRRPRPESPAEPEPVYDEQSDEEFEPEAFPVQQVAVQQVEIPAPPPPIVVEKKEPVVELPKPEPPKPAPVAVKAVPRPPVVAPVEQRVRRSTDFHWSAEEFDGELTDRVWRLDSSNEANGFSRHSNGDSADRLKGFEVA